ncbi:MAG: phosphoribosylformylglycinamidine synthase I [Acidobacteria bacterium]|nr:phosphoribosylformylglycinamidine synthase I [Planctomycetota bacterium]MBE3134482.1 phosphoribosylformylglycinamidine synthase I [Acidobacteriota bacterium]
MPVRALVLRTAGTNCDIETQFAWELAGAGAERVHINRLIENPKRLAEFQILTIPGGFSYGDDIASGKIFANQIVHHLTDAIQEFLAKDRLVLGICNGFQVLVRCGLLPGQDNGRPTLMPSATLTNNDSGKFEDRWVHLRTDSGLCPFLKKGEVFDLPVAHGEGKFMPGHEAPLAQLQKAGQVALRYVDAKGRTGAGYPANPNGSVADIAGICDPTGRILGLMPHPERHVLAWHHPQWTRRPRKKSGDGLAMFKRGVGYFR